MTRHVSVPVPADHHHCPPAADADASSDGSDHDDHPLREPEFVIHAVDEHRRPRAPPPAAAALLPIRHPPPPRDPGAAANAREAAARIERLRHFMLFPQAVLCASTLIFGSMMIYYAANPGMVPDPNFTWLIVLSALVMLLALLSLLLSHLGVYVYDNCPRLDEWLHN